MKEVWTLFILYAGVTFYGFFIVINPSMNRWKPNSHLRNCFFGKWLHDPLVEVAPRSALAPAHPAVAL